MTAVQLSLWPQPDGGGGSAARAPQRPRGGGYQSSCTNSRRGVRGEPAQFESDPRLADLRRMRVSAVWIAVAEQIGFEAFTRAWRILAERPEVLDDRNRLYVPSYAQYLRFQRLEAVRTLAREGLSAPQIAERIRRELGEIVRVDHIRSLMRSI